MNVAVKIDKGIPVPVKKGGGGDFPFADMEIGDSFFISCEQEGVTRIQAKIRHAGKIYDISNRTMRKYSILKVDGGIRCWRRA